MDVKCPKNNLLKSLQKIESISEKNPLKKISEYVLFEVKEEGVFLTATNFQIMVKSSFGAEVNSVGEICIPTFIFSKIVRIFQDEYIIIKNIEKEKIVINSASKPDEHYEVNCLSAEEFPLFPNFPDEDFDKIDEAVLLNMIKLTSFAAAIDTGKASLNGILFEKKGKAMSFVATDSKRLALIKEKIFEEDNKDISGIIPLNTVGEMKRILLGQGKCELLITENKLYFRTADLEMISDLIDSNYPNYNQVIPKEFIYSITINRNEFLDSVKKISILAKEKFQKAIFEINLEEKSIRIYSDSQEAKAYTTIGIIDGVGENLSIAFNSIYLLDTLNSINTENVVLKLNHANYPAMIVPEKNEDYINVIMPLKI